MLALLREVDAALGHPGRLDLVDVGAGRGELLAQLLDQAGRDRGLATRIAARAVEITTRPDGLDPRIRWQASPPAAITGLVIASEWLDNIPLDVAELTRTGAPGAGGRKRRGTARRRPRRRLHGRACGAATRRATAPSWLTRPGVAGVVQITRGPPSPRLRSGARGPGRAPSLREGPCGARHPDGSRHHRARAGRMRGRRRRHGRSRPRYTTQRQALRALGVTGRRPPVAQAGSDPLGYARALSRASGEAELIDAQGLGGFGWLVQAVGLDIPAPLTGLGGLPA
jgi:hypothetical protein